MVANILKLFKVSESLDLWGGGVSIMKDGCLFNISGLFKRRVKERIMADNSLKSCSFFPDSPD